MLKLRHLAPLSLLALAPVPVLSCGAGMAYAYYNGNPDCQAEAGVRHGYRVWTSWDDYDHQKCQNLDEGGGNIRSVWKTYSDELCKLILYKDRACQQQLDYMHANENGCRKIKPGAWGWKVNCSQPASAQVCY